MRAIGWRLSLAFCALAACAHVEERAAEVRYTRTDDGWNLALHHFPPAPEATPRNFPVIVCHGLASNKYNWDLTDELSFPYYLARHGFDVWAVELRASGKSQQPGWFDDLSWNYTFDDYVLHDLPALIEFVRNETGRDQVHWVGHSMGGIVLYGYLQRVGQATVRSALAVASPPYLLDYNRRLNRTLTSYVPIASALVDELPAGTLAWMGSPLAASIPVAEMHFVWNVDNMSPIAARLAAARAVSNLSDRVVEQLRRSATTGALRSYDGVYDYSAGMERITVPMFFVAGTLDALAPPAVVMDAYRSVQAADKRIAVFGRAYGHSTDYGHVDLVLGEPAPAEVFPVLLEWVAGHDDRSGADADPDAGLKGNPRATQP